MSKLYIFGIGGTGSRVIRSLTMLLASGVKCDADTIVPIIIDPDDSAADLTRTVEIMKKYENIRKKLEFSNVTKNQFFKTEISQSVQNFRLPLNNTRDVKFRDYMNVDTLSDDNKALVNMLFSQKNLESNMKVGFKGNPNIGSVVLNQFADSQAFKEFANNFQQGDKIFIISSIFGGTGASGFPLLAKTLRSNNVIPNYALINTAEIGAISVLPYFGVKQDDSSEVDSGTFISKTKSALSYYNNNISENQTVNALYYVADDIRNLYENCEGGAGQQNNAHFIELVSALAILDFASNNYYEGITHKEFGLEKDSQEITLGDFGEETKAILQKPLSQFLYFSKYLKNHKYPTQSWAKDIKIDSALSEFIIEMSKFQTDFINWLLEMDDNKRKFAPFELNSGNKGLFDIVKGKNPNRLLTFKSNYDLFDDYLNAQRIPSAATKEQQFTEIFFNATGELVQKKFNF